MNMQLMNIITSTKNRLIANGPSIISFALFPSDTKKVESDEGGISFHALNKTISPKRGRAVIWPNVMNYDLNIKDSRMFYDTQGISNGATYYLHTIAHLYDFKTPHTRGCIA